MSSLDLYKGVIMEHCKHPKNRGDFSADMQTARVYNSLCGDDIEVGIRRDAGKLSEVRFRGRACSICIASSSMMTQLVKDESEQAARNHMSRMFDVFSENNSEKENELVEPLNALLVVKQHNTRKRCITLPWEALRELIDNSGASITA